MKEFDAQTGGRYVYVDDVLNLQDLSLAFSAIFSECDNFIISGCEVSGNNISGGFVYINGKIRQFKGASNITTWPQYLYERNSTENIGYASGTAKVGRKIYGVEISNAIPVEPDPITGNAPVGITINQTGGVGIKEAFFGKYSLVLNAQNATQVINSALKINGNTEINGILSVPNNRLRIINALSHLDAAFELGKGFAITASYDAQNSYSISMENGVGVCVYDHDTKVACFNKNELQLFGKVSSTSGVLGNVCIDAKGIYNGTDASDTVSLDINMVGLNGANQYARSTRIGNGKGVALLSIDGQTNQISASTTISVDPSANSECLVLLTDLPKTNMAIQRTIAWKDGSRYLMGTIGYTETADMTFRIINNLEGIYLQAAPNSFVNIGPAIKENGQLLSDKYVTSNIFASTLKTLVKQDEVYKKAESDSLYAKLAGGLSNFTRAGISEDTLRQQISAVGQKDLEAYPKKSECLADMATSEPIKKRIRDNIGAAGVDEFQTKLKDSNWKEVSTPGFTGNHLYVRQIGNIVSIQGTLTTRHEGVVFVIPNDIDAPTYGVSKSLTFAGGKTWTVAIKENTRSGIVQSCSSGCLKETYFSLIYMV